jgi:cell division septum initiation protein DivIVA
MPGMLTKTCFRKRLTGPELFLATQEEVDQLLDNISQKAKELTSEAELLHRTVTGGGE